MKEQDFRSYIKHKKDLTFIDKSGVDKAGLYMTDIDIYCKDKHTVDEIRHKSPFNSDFIMLEDKTYLVTIYSTLKENK